MVLSINTAVGSYVSPQGVYDTYTQGFVPVVVMGTAKGTLACAVYVDEILIPRLPPKDKLKAQMFIRGTNDQRPARVRAHAAVRLAEDSALEPEAGEGRRSRAADHLPVHAAAGVELYPGELVDVYIGQD